MEKVSLRMMDAIDVAAFGLREARSEHLLMQPHENGFIGVLGAAVATGCDPIRVAGVLCGANRLDFEVSYRQVQQALSRAQSECTHEEFDAVVEVNRLEDTGRFNADIRVWCAQCGAPMRFKTRTRTVLDLDGIGLSVDGLELRAALEPAT